MKANMKISKKNEQNKRWGHYNLKQNWAMFTVNGVKVETVSDALRHKVVLVFEGGQFIWPGVRVGHKQQKDVGSKTIELETLSMQPLVLSVKNFLEPHECDEIIGLGKGRMRSSDVSRMDHDKGKDAKEFRTSTQAWVYKGETPTVKNIDERVANLTGVPVNHQEDTQVLRYELTQHYSAHLDAWDPQYYQSDTSWFHHGHMNRLATVFWYMSDVEQGGETIFPRAKGFPQPHDMWSCATGLKVKPEKGKVIIFYSLHPNGNVDENSLHGGCPVEKGKKWAANKWVWNKPKSG